MLRIVIALSLASPLAAQTYSAAPAPTRIEEGPELRALHRHLPMTFGGKALLADFDADGLVDVFVDSDLFTAWGGGIFHRTWSGASTWRALAGDVDGDGWVDVVGSSGELLRNDASGGFVPVPGAFPPDTRPMALGDLDGDGDLDALGLRTNVGAVILTNDGSGSFRDTILTPILVWGAPTAIVVGDVDGDDDLDAFLVARAGTQLLLGDGAGGFVDATANLPSASGITLGLALGDLEGDGDLDAVLAKGANSAIWRNVGNGMFETAVDIPGSWTQAVALVDVDGDGDLDAYLSKGYGLTPPYPPPVEADSLALNDGSGSFEPGAPLPLPSEGSSGVTAGDVDGDGDVDLLAWGGVLRLLLGDGTGRFWLDDGGVPATASDNGVLLADLDGDGWLDALTTTLSEPGAPGARVLLGDGTSSVTEDPLGLSPPARSAQNAALGDVDGDGDLDLALANPYDGELARREQDNQLYRNDGGGVFSDVSSSSLPVYVFNDDRGVTLSVAMADADVDGDLDILFADVNDYDGGGGGITFYENDGTGIFTDALLGGVVHGAADLRPLDLEGDGDPDLVVETDLFGLALLENDGTGSFTDVSARLPVAQFGDQIRWFVAADLDGDGDDDLAGVIFNGENAFAFWYAGDGAGSFSDASWLFPPNVALRSEIYAAVDLDLDVDLVGPTSRLENDGTGRFAWSRRAVQGPTGATGVDFADLDADGDLDAFWAARHDAVGSNTTRHVAARGLPRIGKELALDLYGPSAEPWLLAASPSRVRIPLGIGLLQLDLSSAVAVAAGELSHAGRAAWSTDVPPNPVLLGTTLYWQALVGASPRLTNLERTTFTAF